jgi:hypothetical protein
VVDAKNHRRRWENRLHRVRNRPILAINRPGHDGGAASKTISEVRPKITGKSVKIGDF